MTSAHFSKCLLGGIAVTALGLPAKQAIFRVTTHVVMVDVAVSKGGHPVTGLKPEDFSVFDNGVPQTVDRVEDGPRRVDVSILLGSGVRQDRRLSVFESAKGAETLREILTPDDRLRVVECADDARLVAPMERIGPIGSMGRADDRIRGRGTYEWLGMPFNDALFYTLAWPPEPGRRHLAIAFATGFDSWSLITPSRLIELVSRIDSVLHVVLMNQESRDSAYANLGVTRLRAWKENRDALDEAVRRTGGRVHRLDSLDSFREAIQDFRSSYLLTYTPNDVHLSGWHELRVSIRRSSGVTVRARVGYQGQ